MNIEDLIYLFFQLKLIEVAFGVGITFIAIIFFVFYWLKDNARRKK